MARSKTKPLIIYNPRRIFLLAEEFSHANRMLAQLHRNFPNGSWAPRPTIMVHAVSLELYLKCLLVLDRRTLDGRARTHNLKVLFEMLLPETQRNIKGRFDPKVGQEALDDFRAQQRSAGLSDPVGLPNRFNFEFALFGSSKTFEWVRYAYERESRPSEQWYGEPVANAAREEIIERNPSWG